MTKGTHQQVEALETTKRLLDQRQALVSADTIRRRQGGILLAGADHIDAVQLLRAGKGGRVTRPAKRAVRNLELEVLGHCVLADDLAGLEANRRSPQGLLGAAADLRGQLLEVLLGGR